MIEKLQGTLYVECNGSSCKIALNKAKEFGGFVSGYRVAKNSKEHGVDVIIRVKVNDANELTRLGKTIMSASSGIKAIQPTIEIIQPAIE